MNDNWSRPWLRSTFSESDGTGSTTRLCMFLVIFVSLAILAYLAVWRPDTFLTAVTLLLAFDTGICTVLYGINKASGVADKYLDTKTPGGQS